MKILLNSYEKTIREKRDNRDTNSYQKEVDVLNILAFALASYSHRFFKSSGMQEQCITMIYETAMKMLPQISEKS